MKKYSRPFTLVALTAFGNYALNLTDSEGTGQLAKPASSTDNWEPEEDDLDW